MSGKKGMKHYPKELKLEAVRMFFEEGMTRAEITEALGLRSAGRVETWVRQYRREGIAAFNKPIGRPRLWPLRVLPHLVKCCAAKYH